MRSVYFRDIRSIRVQVRDDDDRTDAEIMEAWNFGEHDAFISVDDGEGHLELDDSRSVSAD